MRAGRPIRFVLVVCGGWLGVRAVLLWPAPDAARIGPAIRDQVFPTAVAKPLPATAPATFVRAEPTSRPPSPPPAVPMLVASVRAIEPTPGSALPSARFAAEEGPPPVAASSPERPSSSPGLPPLLPGGFPPLPSRWSGGAWAIARPDGGAGAIGATQLGGSQAGARLAYAIGRERRVALVGRMATPLRRNGREAALGLEWRPTRLPVRIFAEQRIALDRPARGGPSAGVIAGAFEPLPLEFRLEAYGQAGVIGRDRVEGFADGAARVARTVATFGPAKLDLGAGVWGGAQRGAGRLDLGPSLGAALPMGGRTLRVTIDYRARVAGAASPRSGPALSLGTDF